MVKTDLVTPQSKHNLNIGYVTLSPSFFNRCCMEIVEPRHKTKNLHVVAQKLLYFKHSYILCILNFMQTSILKRHLSIFSGR